MNISIIIPFFNVQQYTDILLQRLSTQVDNEVEVIVVDDGSEVPFTTKYEWVKVIRQENKGPSSARNRGLREAKGEYIVFIDADDLVAHDYIAQLRKVMPFDYVEMSWKSLPGGANFDVKLYGPDNKLNNPSAVTRAFSRKCIGDVRFNEHKWAAEDEEFTRKVCTPDKLRKVITGYMYFYRTSTPNSITKQFRANKLRNKIIVYHYNIISRHDKWLLKEIMDDSADNEVVVMCSQCYLHEIKNYARVIGEHQYVEGMILKGEPTPHFHQLG